MERVSQHLGRSAGIDVRMLPWQVEDVRGTIWIMAHDREGAFDGEDCRITEVLSNFAATGVRLERQQKSLLEQARVAGENALANSIAHQINNPLQELMQTVYLLARKDPESDAFAQKITGDLTRLSEAHCQLLSGQESCD